MGIKRIVDTAFWTDSKVDEFTPEDKYFMLYLLTCPFTKQLGIYEISIKQVAFHLGYSIDAVKALIERFESKYEIIIFSPETNEIAVKNYLRHSIVKGGAPVRDCLIKEIKQVKNKQLISDVFAYIKDFDNLNATVKQLISDYEKSGANLDFCNKKEKETKKEKDNVNDNENENDNDNEVSYPVSYDDTYNDTFSTSKKRIYGKFNNVLLTDEELQKLKAEYSDYEERIERLSAYMKFAKRTYDDHYATIELWALDDKKKNQPQQSCSNPFLALAIEKGIT